MKHILLIVSVLLVIMGLNRQRRKDTPFFIVGHRGARGLAPENTLVSLNVARELGIRSMEVDIHRTRDHVLMVMHDAAVDRTTNGRGKIGELDWSAIAELDAGQHKGEQFIGEPVPTLDDVLKFIMQHDITLYIEVKDPELYPGIEQELAAQIREHGAQSKVIIISFDLAWLNQFNQSAPDIPVGALWTQIQDVNAVPGARYIDVHWSSALRDFALIQQAKQTGRTVLVWTVNSPLLAVLLKWMGIHGITTDRPDLLRHLAD